MCVCACVVHQHKASSGKLLGELEADFGRALDAFNEKYDDALHGNAERIIAQLDEITSHARITAIDGAALDVSNARTICIHGDHAASVAAIRQWKTASGQSRSE